MSGWTPPPLPSRWTRAAAPRFVGRRGELDCLEDLWTAVRGGARQVAFLGGEPGAGKSRLLAEFCALLHDRGATVLLGTCVAEFGPPYQPFVEPVEALLSATGPGGPRDALARLVGRSEDTAEPDTRRELYDAAVDAIRTLTRTGPVVLALEDLHWCGVAGLQLLAHLVDRTAESPLMVLGTHRTTAPERSAALTATIANLYRLDGVRRLDLAGLSTEDIAEYLAHEATLPEHRARVAAALLRDRTGGNPFLLRELLRESAGTVPGPGASAPLSVQDMVAGRLERLSAPERQTLELAAVVGEECDLATLLAVSAWGEDTTLAALDTAVAHGLLESAGPAFRFPHSLARQAVLDLVPATRRAREHLRVAAVLEASGVASDRRTQRLAHHYAQGAALGAADRAVRYLTEAAQAASRSLAHEDAARWFEQAAALAEDPPHGHRLLLSAASAHLLGGDFARARALYAEVANAGGVRDRLEAAIGFEAASWRPGLPGQRAVELLTEALRGVPHDPADPLYVRGLAGLGRALAFLGATDQAGELGRRSVELARALEDDVLLAAVLEASLWNGLHPADAPAKLARATELSELAQRIGDPSPLGPAGFWRAAIAYQQGEPEVLAAAYWDVLRMARATGEAYFEYVAGCIRYGRQFLAGDFAGADGTCEQLLELGATFGTDDTEGSTAVQRFMVRRETGALEAVRALVSGEESPEGHWAPGLLALYTELRLDRPAHHVLRWLVDGGLERYEDAQWPCVLAFTVEAAVHLDDADALRTLRPRVAEYSGTNLRAGQFVAVFGSADRYLGMVDSALGRGTAVPLLEAALEMDTRMGAVVHRAQSLAALADHLRRGGDPGRRARALAEEAGQLARDLGLRRVLRALRPAAVPVPVPAAAPSRPAGLTAREAEVLRLLGEGLLNREISARLVISENTVANHVRSILAKTGAGNRTQAAMYAATHGLLEGSDGLQ
ncbi:helix-turn-helix transcriptional regulator [Geodermatophilus sabuli]|uniref:Predicted ATPase n=1 Tax=Geodermatophilus sabuli TaxID=1564158 RepID=A0A285EBL6_9ACTN|nr:helix-turn-helix transcriptional regulator [Geodermatophilus sabuli]MBB3085319.1 DNA-binding CsgD family transcriptional regulator/tetratricopeptide (TPR) repeat protein [Geodermatophilus sabuli]SNX96253.1 Predicted ATPase [Geodermatophilus sabuli]